MNGKRPQPLIAGASWQSGSNVAVFRPFRSALRVEPNPSLKLLRSSLVQSAFFGQGQQGLVYLRQIFVRLSHGDEMLATCPSTGSSTATTIKSRSSSSKELR